MYSDASVYYKLVTGTAVITLKSSLYLEHYSKIVLILLTKQTLNSNNSSK